MVDRRDAHQHMPVPALWSPSSECEVAWAATPKKPGLYRWFLDGPLPEPFNWPEHLQPLRAGDLIYVGKATNLHKRAKHHKLPTATSSLRRTLASLMGFPGIWKGSSAHPSVSADHHAFLKDWMLNDLLMSFRELNDGEKLRDAEIQLREETKPPFNKDSLTPEQDHAEAVGELWLERAAAGR